MPTKKKLSEYEQRLHNNWLRRQERVLQKTSKAAETVAYSKESLQLHWQDQAALDEQHRRELAMRAQKKKLKRAQQRRKQEVDDWIKTNNKTVDTQKLAKLWEETARQHRDQLLNLAIKAFAIVDAAAQANRALKLGLNMEGAELDVKEVGSLVTRFLRLEMGVLLTKNTRMDKDLKEQILSRLVAREFPTRDNRPLPTRQRPLDPTRVLQQALRDEVSKFDTP